VNDRFPLILLTGRGTAAQSHTQTRTGKSAVLRKLAPTELHLEIHPADAERYGVRQDDWVDLSSRRGTIRARAFLSPTVRPGQVFLAMHEEATNRLTDAVFDPHSHQPAYKACAVCVRRCSPSE